MISQVLLKKYLEYRDGHLWWIKSRPNVKVGQQFGTTGKHGYREGSLKKYRLKEHRLVWLYHNGKWPHGHLDHINGDRSDNRIENLREVTPQQNQFNKKSFGKTSQYKGVCFSKTHKKWRAAYRFNKKEVRLGYFNTETEAAEAYRKATEHLHGEYANYG